MADPQYYGTSDNRWEVSMADRGRGDPHYYSLKGAPNMSAQPWSMQTPNYPGYQPMIVAPNQPTALGETAAQAQPSSMMYNRYMGAQPNVLGPMTPNPGGLGDPRSFTSDYEGRQWEFQSMEEKDYLNAYHPTPGYQNSYQKGLGGMDTKDMVKCVAVCAAVSAAVAYGVSRIG